MISLRRGALSSGTRPLGMPPKRPRPSGFKGVSPCATLTFAMVSALFSRRRLAWRSREWTSWTMAQLRGAFIPSRSASSTMPPFIASISVRKPRTRSCHIEGRFLASAFWDRTMGA